MTGHVIIEEVVVVALWVEYQTLNLIKLNKRNENKVV